MKRLISATRVFLTFLLLVLASLSPAFGATISVDRLDFPPGAFAIINGSGFEPHEPIQFSVEHVGEPDDPTDYWLEFANGAGNVETYWYVSPNSLGDTLLLTALGFTSGALAQTTFTDAASAGTHTTSFSSGGALSPGTYTTTLTINNVNTGIAATTDDMHAVQIDIPAGASVSWGAVAAFNAANSPITWDQTPNVIAANTYGFTRNNSAGTKVPPGGRVTIVMSITLYDTACFAVRAYSNNGYGNAFGSNGSVSQCFTITNPGIAPSFTSCPADLNLNASGTCSATATYSVSTTGAPAPTLTYVLSGATTGSGSGTGSGSSFNVGTTTVTITASNGSGTATCVFQVVVSDGEAPAISSVPDAGSALVNGSCEAVVPDLATGTVASDNCTAAGSLVKTQLPAAGTLVGVGSHVIVVTVTDASGNSSSASSTFTVTDATAPSLSLTAPAGASANSNCEAPVPAVAYSSADNCGGVTVSQTPPAGTMVGVGTHTITVTATDGSNNSTSQSTSFTVSDTTLPSIAAPADLSVNADSGECFATGVDLGSPVASDNCGVTVSNNAPSQFPVGTTLVTWTATDPAGKTATATQTVTTLDSQNPTITAPENVAANADEGECSATGIDLGTPTVGDNCGVASVANNAPSSYPVGVTVVTWTVTDVHGNIATTMQTVTVTDNQNPSITAPAAVAVNADEGECSASEVTLGTPATNDNCAVASVSNNAPASFPVGSTTVTWTVIDVNGNSATATQTVTVADDQNPTITAPAAVNASADAGLCSASEVELGTPTVADNCGVADVSNNAPASFPVGSTTVTWRVTDVNGNSATATQVVTVTDDENPTITAPAAVSVNTDPGQCHAAGVALGSPETGDNCAVASVTNNAPAEFPVGATTVTWTVTDASGNTATATQVVTVADNQAPTISIAGVSTNADQGECHASGVNLGTPATGDNCGVASVTNNAPAQFPVGSTVVTWTVTDVNSNTATTTQTVTVTDTQNPTITAPAAVSASADAGQCYATGVSLGSPSTADNCGVASVSNNAPTQFTVGATLVTWTVVDVNGNSATASQLVTVTDNENPVIVCPADITVSSSPVTCGAVVNFTVAASDNCPGVSVVSTAGSGSTFPVGTTTVSSVATDASGNTASCSFTVTVVDTTAPQVITRAASVQLVNGAASITVADVNNGSWDNCGIVAMSLSTSQFGCGDVGYQTVTLYATDAAGNVGSATAQVQVISQASEVTGRDSIYTGEQVFWTNSSTSSTASLALSATIRTECGDITLARVRFYVRPRGGPVDSGHA